MKRSQPSSGPKAKRSKSRSSTDENRPKRINVIDNKSDGLRVFAMRAKRPEISHVIVNTTSSSKTWSKGLSPFFVGPIPLYDEFVAQNMENAWQYSKVYSCHVDEKNQPTEAYW
eukprot:TRINITY_DN11892_c0_g3_i3.p2 TRINITY_DN11892_c0_g3~~TRINITY_DN11892_c0_g3_i3.p2  ORF type:complete len:114 (-),score=12.54 TRINITY_DN11892_c0_g3_i3:137-478(-)